jgi:type IV secretion system protein VirB4
MLSYDSYRPRDRAFSEHLRYVTSAGNGVVKLRKHGFLVGFAFRGPDTLGTSWEELRYRDDQIAGLLGTRDAEWCFNVTMQRTKGGDYPTNGCWPDPVLYLLDQARRERYQADGQHFIGKNRLWVAWHPQGHRRGVVDWLFGEGDDTVGDLDKFDEQIAILESSLRPYFKEFRRLGTVPHRLVTGEEVMADEVAAALMEEIHGSSGLIAGDTSAAVDYDALLSPSWVDLKPDLRIGDRYIGIVSVQGYPQVVWPSMLDDLRSMPCEMRYSVRIIPYSIPDAEKVFHKRSSTHLLTSLGIGLFMNKGGQEADETPMAWRNHIKQATKDARAGVPFGQVNPKVIVYGKTPQERDEACNLIKTVLEARALRPLVEDNSANRFFSFLGTLPGEIDADEIRAARLPLAGALRLAPVTSLWHGAEKHPDKRFGPDARPLLMMTTPMREPFRLFLHTGEVGNTLVFGRTGRGKSVLLRALEVGHLVGYPGARVLTFDIGRSAYKLAKAVNGRHYTPQLGTSAQVAPLTGIDTTDQAFEEILDWNVSFCELWLGRPLTIHDIEMLRHALDAIRNMRMRARLSDVGRVLQDEALRQVYEQVKGSFMDAQEDGFDFQNAAVPYWVYEIGALGVTNYRWTVPFMLYVQRRAFEQFAKGDSAPTLITMDEGARALKIPRAMDFAERVERESRKNRGQFIFVTQSADEVVNSDIASVLIEQTATRISFANRQLTRDNRRLRDQYLQVGFTEDDLDNIAELGEFDVLVRNEYGVQAMALAPTAVELALIGGASGEDCDLVDEMIRRHGPSWVEDGYLAACGIPGLDPYAKVLATIRGAYGAARTSLEVAI